MVFWYLLILLVALIGVRFCKEGYCQDYLGKEQGNAVKGVFIMLVFLGHAIADIKQCGFVPEVWVDKTAYDIWRGMGQLVVAMFLFYSGFGVMRSLMNKGEAYLDTYPKSRLLTTLVNFDIAVCVFVLLALILGRKVAYSQVFPSFIGWDSVGNSNWYIFIILCCYFVFYLVFKMVGARYLAGTLLLGFVLFVGMLVLHEVKGRIWYNTILVFPAGVLYALYAEELEKVIQKRYILSLLVLLIVFLSLRCLCGVHPLHGLTHNMAAIVFSVLVVAITMKVKISNRWLVWCGFSLFPIYIYQRLPMYTVEHFAGDVWVSGHPHLFIAACFTVTAGISVLYNKFLRIKFK